MNPAASGVKAKHRQTQDLDCANIGESAFSQSSISLTAVELSLRVHLAIESGKNRLDKRVPNYFNKGLPGADIRVF